jgi:hypothetical protein
MKDVVVYAPKDQRYVAELLLRLQDAQAVRISSTALDAIMAVPVRHVLLLMSIYLLYHLECEEEYQPLLQRLKLFEREDVLIIVPLWPCSWRHSFETGRMLPPGLERSIAVYRPAKRGRLYEQIAAQLAAGE